MISVKNIIKTFEDGVTVLKGVDCQIEKGEVVATTGLQKLRNGMKVSLTR